MNKLSIFKLTRMVAEQFQNLEIYYYDNEITVKGVDESEVDTLMTFINESIGQNKIDSGTDTNDFLIIIHTSNSCILMGEQE